MANLTDEQIAQSAQVLNLDPAFDPHLANRTDHGAYLEAVHESTVRTLAVIHMRLARGDVDAASDLVSKLRLHIDTLWSQRSQAAQRGVRQ